MAKYGAKYIKWAPFAAETPDADPTKLPSYGTPVSLGALNQLADSPVFNEARLPGDNDPTSEYVSEFKECGIDLTVTELPMAVAASVFGATMAADGDDTDLKFGAEDSAPYGGLAFYINKMVGGVKSYQGICYPKSKATVQGNDYATKGDSITLTGDRLHLLASAPASGQWKILSQPLATESEAQAWVDGKIRAAT